MVSDAVTVVTNPDEALVPAAVADIAAYYGMKLAATVAYPDKGLDGLWHCSRARVPGQCGWYGVEQTQRRTRVPVRLDPKDPESAVVDWVTGPDPWLTAPWCPRCGAPAILAAPLDKGLVLWLRDGDDVPSGVQHDERPALIEEHLAALEAAAVAQRPLAETPSALASIADFFLGGS